MIHLTRLGPVLEPQGDIGAIFNCAAIEHNGFIYLLARVVKKGYVKARNGRGYENYISEIRLARSADGIHFTLDQKPLIRPEHDYEEFGCEDARVTKLGDEYLITYTALSRAAFTGRGERIGLAVTKDFRRVEKYGIIGPSSDSKAGAFFSEIFDGKVWFLFKNEEREAIQLAFFDKDFLRFSNQEQTWQRYDFEKNIVLTGRNNEWENRGVEIGAPPIKTEKGWLLIYSGISRDFQWSIGAALLDLENPQRVIGRSSSPILKSELEYERFGDVPNVVFPEGAVVRGDELFLYYGAADKVCALATCKLKDLLDFLLQHS